MTNTNGYYSDEALINRQVQATIAENPVYIQSRDSGKVYDFKYILNSGLYAYADSDNFLIVISAEEIATKFHDVTELETRLRAELVKIQPELEAMHEALRDATVCEWFAMCDNFPTTVQKVPWGYVPICERCNDKVEGMKK